MTDGQVTNERQYNGDWNPVWDRQGRTVRRRLDGRGRHSVQVAALPAGQRADLGLQRAPRSTGGRTRSRSSRACRARWAVARSTRRRSRRRWSGSRRRPDRRNLEIKPYAISDLTTDRARDAARLERSRRRRRARRRSTASRRTSPPTSPTTPTSRRSRPTSSRST